MSTKTVRVPCETGTSPCSLCGTESDVLYDTATKLGPWANLCRVCAAEYGYPGSSVTTRLEFYKAEPAPPSSGTGEDPGEGART